VNFVLIEVNKFGCTGTASSSDQIGGRFFGCHVRKATPVATSCRWKKGPRSPCSGETYCDATTACGFRCPRIQIRGFRCPRIQMSADSDPRIQVADSDPRIQISADSGLLVRIWFVRIWFDRRRRFEYFKPYKSICQFASFQVLPVSRA
jgi:hypothetical protein